MGEAYNWVVSICLNYDNDNLFRFLNVGETDQISKRQGVCL